MADAEDLFHKITKNLQLQKRCVRKLSRLAVELETVMTANVTEDAIVPEDGAGILESGPSLSTTVSSKSTIARQLNEAEEELQDLQELIQDLMTLMETEEMKGQPPGSCDDGDMQQLVRSEGKQQGLKSSHSVNLRRMCGLPKAKFTRKINENRALLAGMKKLLQQFLLQKKVGTSVGKQKYSTTLYEYAVGLKNAAEEMEKVLQKIRFEINTSYCEIMEINKYIFFIL